LTGTKKNTGDIYNAMSVEPEVFPNVFCQDGLEADDMIAECCSILSRCRPQSEAVMVTTDKDLFQCLGENPLISWYSPTQNKEMDCQKFIKEYGIEPKLYAMVKAISGCTSDNVPGVSGVGEITALKYIKNELNKSYKKYKDIQSNIELINFNKELVCLPHKSTKPFGIRLSPVNSGLLDRWCEDNDLFVNSGGFDFVPF
jgi:5'-3' exonuclease